MNNKRNNNFFIPTIYNNFKRRRYAYGLVVFDFNPVNLITDALL